MWPEQYTSPGEKSFGICAEAKAGQILTDRKVLTWIEDLVEAVPVGDLALKGFMQPVPAYDVERIRESAIASRSP